MSVIRFCLAAVLTAVLLASASSNLSAQRVFSDVSGRTLSATSPFRALDLQQVRQLSLNPSELAAVLSRVPQEGSQQEQLIDLPTPSGKTRQFTLTEYSLFTDGPKAGFRTFYGSALDDPSVHLRAEYTDALGFRVQVNDHGKLSFIEPSDLGDPQGAYIAFAREEAKRPAPRLECGFDGSHADDDDLGSFESTKQQQGQRSAGDCTFRSYRLAVSTTAEYSAFFNATSAAQSAQVLAAVTTTVNRVNGVYETEAAVRLLLLSNTANSFYYNAATDPFTDGNAGQMLNANTPALNGIYGSGGYDIGHVFGVGGNNGVAYLRSVCTGNKGGGVTLRTNPVGDAFDIDYVAHEMGHQFGGNHTQNNNCNRSSQSYEPGSASTIMGYAGICAPNVQNNSDAYFHAVNLGEIANFVTGTANSCATVVSSSNSAPSVTAGSDRTIPHGTPFTLTATGSDPNGDALTYQWEHYDNGTASMPPSPSNSTGPNFRSLFATASPTRAFPNEDAVRTGITPTWEVLPGVARSSTFRVTARDNRAGGCTDEDDLTVTWTSQGPFSVIAPSGANNFWQPGTPVEVQWSVAGTNAAPVNCGTVDIMLSLDGGFTYPTTLATGVPNTGVYNFVAPSNLPLTNDARVRIECSNGDFYNVSADNFTISNNPPTILCSTVQSTNVGLPIGPNAGTVTTSTLQVTQAFAITSTRVLGLAGDHTYSGDLEVSLVSPTGTQVDLFSDLCSFNNDFNLSLSDGAATTYANISCPLTGGQEVQPESPLSALNGENAAGTWTLNITDDADQDGGTLQAWGVEVCYDQSAPLPVSLLDFSASAKTDHIRLDWATALEFNHDRFIVERKRSSPNDDYASAEHWEAIGQRYAIGEDGGAYAFEDYDVVLGQPQYYRLSQVDRDGTRSESAVVSATLAPGKDGLQARYANGRVFVDSGSDETISVFNALGVLVHQQAATGERTAGISTATWPAGHYVVVQGDEQVQLIVQQ